MSPTPTAAVGIDTIAVDRWTRTEAHSDVALEAQVVAAWEFESIETSHQRFLVRVVLPIAEYARIGGASILVGDFVLKFSLLFHRLGHTASCKASVDEIGLHIHLEQKIIANLSTADLFSVERADRHDASRWRASVGDRARGGHHAHVKAQRDCLLTGIVDTFDVIGTSAVSDQLGMLLYDQYE